MSRQPSGVRSASGGVPWFSLFERASFVVGAALVGIALDEMRLVVRRSAKPSSADRSSSELERLAESPADFEPLHFPDHRDGPARAGGQPAAHD